MSLAASRRSCRSRRIRSSLYDQRQVCPSDLRRRERYRHRGQRAPRERGQDLVLRYRRSGLPCHPPRHGASPSASVTSSRSPSSWMISSCALMKSASVRHCASHGARQDPADLLFTCHAQTMRIAEEVGKEKATGEFIHLKSGTIYSERRLWVTSDWGLVTDGLETRD